MTLRLLPSNDKHASLITQRWIFVFLVIAFLLHVWRIFSLNATYDQGLFLQEIWNGLHGRPFESTLASELSAPVLFDGSLPKIGYLHLSQHFTPLLILWIPFVGLFGLWALPLIQVGLIALAGWVLFLLGKEYLSPRLAGWVACSFFMTAPVLGPSLENFHDLCLVPLLVFTLLLGIARNHRLLYFLPALLLPFVREDVGLISFGIGIWMIIRRPNWRMLGFGLCIYSVIYVLIITNWAMPLFGSEISRRFMQERFRQYLHGEQGGTLDVLIAMVTQPGLLLREIISPPISTFRFLLTLALPLGLIPWLSKDSWLLIAFPLFVALSSRGGNAMAVSLRFMLYLVPGIFAGSIFWWKSNQKLFESKKIKMFWRFCLAIAFGFALVGNPHRSLSALIPDSVQPWVHAPIHKSWERGLATRKVINIIPPESSVAAETQLVPQLAQRRLLFRFPENYQYFDLEGNIQSAEYIISQPRYNAVYAPAFDRESQWLKKSLDRMEELVDNDYGVFYCDSQSIVLKHQHQSTQNLRECFSSEVQLGREILSNL